MGGIEKTFTAGWPADGSPEHRIFAKPMTVRPISLLDLRPKYIRRRQVFAFVIKAGAYFLQGKFPGDVESPLDVPGREDEAREGHALKRRQILHGRFANVQSPQSCLRERRKILHFGAVQSEADERQFFERRDILN